MTSPTPPPERAPRMRRTFWTLVALCCLGSLLSYFLLDKAVIDWLATHRPLWRHSLAARAFQLLGKSWPPIWLLLVWVAGTRRWRRTAFALIALVVVMMAVWVVKPAVQRPRPRQVIAAAQQAAETGTSPRRLRGHSFPSGDTASAFATAAALALGLTWPGAVALFAIAAGVGAMRVVVLAHYPSDVFAGAAVGILAVWAASWIVKRWHLWEMPAELWARRIALAGVVCLPVAVGLANGADVTTLFLKTYAPLGLLLYVVARRQRSVAGPSGP